MINTENITIYMNVVDLEKIDLLVEQGFYSDRADFFKIAVRSKLDKHNFEIKETIIRKTFSVGVVYYNYETLENELKQKNMLEIKVVGMLVLQDNIPVELALQTIKSIKVFGIFRANEKLKIALKDRIQ